MKGWFLNNKVALSLCGVCYGVKHRDWRRDKENIHANVIEPINPSVYITTYPNETTNELLEFYNPKRVQFLPWEGSDLRLTYRKSLELLRDEDVDLIISTRFDILFNDPIWKYDVNPDKFNFFFKEQGWWGSHQYTADPQYFSIFPKIYLNQLIDAVQDVYDRPHRHDCPDLHPAYSRLAPVIGPENIHFIFDVETLSHDNKYVVLDRSL